jgi:hypothetical protein
VAGAVVILLAAIGVAAYVFLPSDDGPGTSTTSSPTPTGPGSSRRPSIPSAEVREFLRNWMLPTTTCKPAYEEFPFTPPAPSDGLVEAFVCRNVNHGGKNTVVLGARFTSDGERARFLAAHGLSDVTTKQERKADNTIQTIWYRAGTGKPPCLGWLMPGLDMSEDAGRQLFKTVEY